MEGTKMVEYGDQIALSFENKGCLKKVCDLNKSRTPMVAKVLVDEYTQKASESFDYDFDGENKFYPFEFPNELKNADFNILCIVGASGSGKSVFSKYFGQQKELCWDNTKSILSNFDTPDDGIERLNSVGLNSIPTWCKPRNVLSIGEGFRADLARQIESGCVIDEFTSTVDRNVAISCSKSISKYIKNKGLKKCVFVSCHKDFIDALQPDYVIDLDDKCVYDTRGGLRQRFEISIYEICSKQNVWDIFKHNHYLSANLNMASRCFVAFYNNELVAFISLLPLPNGYIENGYKVHRLVVLPDYQGLGIASKLLLWFANVLEKTNCKLYIRTSHIKLKNFLQHNKNWVETARSGQVSPPMMLKDTRVRKERIAYSFKYIGEYDEKLNEQDVTLYCEKHKNKKTRQLSLFDM